MDYLLDTNIVLIYTRENPLTEEIEAELQLFNGQNRLFISVVTVAEIQSIAFQNKYGEKKRNRLNYLLSKFSVININIQDIIDRYVEIDAYSQGNHPGFSPSFSARNMGKNDLWIAATSSVYDLTLITTDVDFDHLQGYFIKLVKINRGSN